jgi:hypothetical protein
VCAQRADACRDAGLPWAYDLLQPRAMSLHLAKSRINQARDQIQSNRIDDLDRTLASAEGFLTALPDAEKSAVLAEIAALRAEAAAMLQPEEKLKLSGARGKLRQAKEYIDRGYDPADTAKLVVMIEDYLVHVRDQHKAAELVELAAIKAKIAPAPAPAPVAAVPAVGSAPVAAPAAPAAPGAATVDDKAAVDNFTYEVDTCRRGAERDGNAMVSARAPSRSSASGSTG